MGAEGAKALPPPDVEKVIYTPVMISKLSLIVRYRYNELWQFIKEILSSAK